MFYSVPLAKYFTQNPKTLLINACLCLGCSPVITVVNKRKVKFLADYVTACNSLGLCMLFACVAQKELDALQSTV